jgi:hypothetical protein
MNSRRFPSLFVMLTSAICDTSGMVPVSGFDLATVCDDDLIPGTKASELLQEAISEFQREAFAVASVALDFDGTARSGPFFSALPRFGEADFPMILLWRGSGGATFMASTHRIPEIHPIDAEFAGHDKNGRIVYFEDGLPE